jgi:hypothetical protein
LIYFMYCNLPSITSKFAPEMTAISLQFMALLTYKSYSILILQGN